MHSLRYLILCLPCLLLAACASPKQASTLKAGMTKNQVVARHGFPASAALNAETNPGASGYESWVYYQIDRDGNITPQSIIFGNTARNLGRVVSYDPDFGKDRILNIDRADDLGKALAFEAKRYYTVGR